MTEQIYDQVYREYMEKGKDPVYRLALEIYLGELMQENILYHHGQIQAIADKAMLDQLNVAKHAITKRYLADRIAEIRKTAKEDFKESNWVREGGKFARYRGAPVPKRGNFTPEGKHIDWGTDAQDYHQVVRSQTNRLPFSEQQSANRVMGLLAKPEALPVEVSDADHKADVYTRAQELTHDLENKTQDPRNKQRIQYLVSHPDGRSRIILPQAGRVPGQGKGPTEIDWEGGERVQYMTPVGPDNPVTVGGQVLNIGLVGGADAKAAAKMGSVAEDIKTTLNSTKWGEKFQSTANVVKVLSENSPMAVQAHAVAQLFNLIGPDAARAFGPKLRQLTYRYTGQEALPDQYSAVAKEGLRETPKGKEPITGYEGRLIEDLGASIPTRSEFQASLQSGSTPPSKGYILDKEGRVVSEAVGYSDDWYTPFNLRKLPSLKDGSYVRTRAYGGITPEDLRLAMRTGAKRVTVVSNSGTFTMEFEPKALHWGHRFGFGGGMMLRRYTKSLDAIKNGEVARPDGEGGKVTLNAEGYHTAMLDLQMKYPYWITKGSESGIPFVRPGPKSVRSQDHNRNDDQGYVKPLSINASGARAGWAEKDHAELWAPGRPGQKFAYDSHERYRLMSDQKLKVIRSLSGTTSATAATPSSGTRTYVSSGSTAQSAGAVRTERAYPQVEKLNKGQMDGIMHDMRRLFRQADDLGDTPDLKDYDYLSVLHPLLTENTNYTNLPEYQELRNKLADNPDIRRELAVEIGDAFAGKNVKGVDELLPRLHSETADETDEEAGAAAAAELYSESDVPAFASVDTSPEMKRQISLLEIKSEEGDTSSTNALTNMRFYKNRLRDVEAAGRRGQQPSKLSENNQKVFDSINREVTRILNHEREKTADTGDTGDDGARTTVKGSYSLTLDQLKSFVRMPTEEAVADISTDIYEENGGDDESLLSSLEEAEAFFHRHSGLARKQGEGAAEKKFSEIAVALNRQYQDLEQDLSFQRRVKDKNT